jgi:ribonuclease HI
MTPRVKTFGWRILRKAVPTGARAGKFSKHISKLCCRCGAEENDVHLFFLCPFVRATWFSKPWYIKIDQVAGTNISITQTILNILNMQHPHASIDNILTFLWCVWKARNDCLFNKKDTHPLKIQHMANAINQNMEMVNVVQDALEKNFSINREFNHMERRKKQDIEERLEQGDTLKSDLLIKGSKFFTDASWKTKEVPGLQGISSTGIGVYCQIVRQGVEENILIQAASIEKTLSPLHAETMGLILAAQLAEKLNIKQITFLTDCIVLAKAAAAPNISDKHVPWELRKQIADYKKESRNLEAKVYHIKRNLNGIAHDCAQQAIRQDPSTPIFSCNNSAHLRLGTCPTISSLQNFNPRDIVLHAVNCL